MNILAEIIAHKKTEIAAYNVPALRRLAESSPTPRDFLSALQHGRIEHGPGLIAELKQASPSKGLMAPHLDLLQVADVYAENGAAAISVLTDAKFFLGKIDTLQNLRFRRRLALPLLRKDFIIHEAQIYETRASGADAILLIAAALTDGLLLKDFHALALELGLTPLVEVHDQAETERVLKMKDVRLIGINNRNLVTFEASLKTTEQIRPLIPSEIAVVAESGIFTSSDVDRLSNIPVDGILVGEALVTAPDIAAKVRELAGVQP